MNEARFMPLQEHVDDLTIHLLVDEKFMKKEKGSTMATVFFIHGAGSNHHNWFYQYQELALNPHLTTITVDLPGHGLSTWFREKPSPPDVNHYALVMLKLIEKLSLRNVWLVGHSMGGAIVQAMALKVSSESPSFVEIFKGIIIIGSGSHLPVSSSLLRLLETNPRVAMEKLIKWSIYKGIEDENPQRYRDLKNMAKKIFSRAAPSVTLFDFQACARFDVRERISRVEQPIGIIVGQNDVMTPPTLSEELGRSVSNSLGLEKIPHSGHLVMLERPRIVNLLLKKWILEP